MTTGQPIPPDFGDWDFREVLLSWRVRGRHGSLRTFHTLNQLKQLMVDEEVDGRDVVSCAPDGWTLIDSIDDLDGWFWEMWQRAERKEISSLRNLETGEDVEDEDSADAPTLLYTAPILGPDGDPNL